MKVSTSEVYRCSVERYVEEYFNPEGRHRRVAGAGGVSFSAKEVKREAPEWTMRAELVEKLNAPAPVRKLFGEINRLEEESRWAVGGDLIQVVVRPDRMRDKLSIQMLYRLEGLADGTCKVTLDMEIQARVFGVGGLIEKMAAKEMPEAFSKDAAYFNEHFVS
ncbi:MAG: DUF2505 family protein [Polyangia bacterium]|jgi:hypothetical protein|nr:DUF2505 family protein [Polyangia bacterium]